MRWRWRWVVVGFLALVAAGASGWVWRRFSTLESLNALWALLSGLVAVLTPLVVWAARGRPPAVTNGAQGPSVGKAAEGLASAVTQQ